MNNTNADQTRYISEKLERCEDSLELNEIISNLTLQKTRWIRKAAEIFDPLLKRQGLSKAKYSKSSLCTLLECSRPALDSWLKGIIPSRENMIRLGLLAEYSEDEINELLMKYGYYQELYPKILSDCVCIFVINSYAAEN